MSRYTFSYFNQEPDNSLGDEFPLAKSMTSNIDFDSGAPWDIILTEFLSFLSSIYGYDISKHVDVQSFEQRIAMFRDDCDSSEGCEFR